MKTADTFLSDAATIMQERAASRDKGSERSMGKAVAVFNVLHDTNLTEVQGWDFMSILKKVRGSQGEYREDDYADEVAYAALKAEAASKEHELKLDVAHLFVGAKG